MTRVGRALLGAIAATALVLSCVQEDNLKNDEESFTATKKDGGTRKDGGTKKDAASDDDDDTGDDDTGDDDTGDDDTGDDDTGDDDEPTPTADSGTKPGDASTTPPKSDGGGSGTGKIAGSATRAKCSSYQKASGGMCAGYFCGVTKEDIESELKSTVCPMATGESVCGGQLTVDVAACARSEKTNLANVGLTDEQLRPKVQECVYKKDPAYKESAPPKCIGCFLDAAQCASTNCILECLSGDSAQCDMCRQKNNCNAPVMKCAELPSPF